MRNLFASASAFGLIAFVAATPLLAQAPNPADVTACVASDISAIDQAKNQIDMAGNNAAARSAAISKLKDAMTQLELDRGKCPPELRGSK